MADVSKAVGITKKQSIIVLGAAAVAAVAAAVRTQGLLETFRRRKLCPSDSQQALSVREEVPAVRNRGSHSEEWAAVLEFWFGGGDLKKNYSSKWFAAGSVQADADQAVLSQFGHTLQQAERGELDHWKTDTAGCVALIIVLDQFSRHVYRNQPRENIDRNDLAALKIATEMLEKSTGEELPLAWQIFSLMPLRHQPTEARLELVLQKMGRRQLQHDTKSDLMRRFVAQTSRRLLDLQGMVQ